MKIVASKVAPVPFLSICIPTYERPIPLRNCLESILRAADFHPFDFEVCISDNSKTSINENLLNEYKRKLQIRYKHNGVNLGLAANFKNCVEMATGKFIWLVGDDDLLIPSAFEKFHSLQSTYPNVEFFYINAFNLDLDFLNKYEVPFDTGNLPLDMSKFSKYQVSKEILFDDLIQVKYSFDFLGGMFLSIFSRELWIKHQESVLPDLPDCITKFSNLDNTFPHSKIFANAFMGQSAYFSSEPIIVAVSGIREWSRYYPLIRTFRLLDLLREYRIHGLGLLAYLRNKNSVVKYFVFDSIYYITQRDNTFPRINLFKYLLPNLILPNMYLSILRYLAGKFRKHVRKMLV